MTTYAGQWGPYPLTMPNAAGIPQFSVAFEVVLAGTLTPATIYTDRLKSNPTTTPHLVTNDKGFAKFFADPATAGYDIRSGGRLIVAGVTVDLDVAEEQASIPPGTFAKPATSGTLAARPAATVIGQRYKATDVNGGTLYESIDGSTWSQMAPGITEASAEATRATAAESTLTASVATNTTNIATNASAIATETSRATAAEALALAKSANLSDVASPATALANLGGQALTVDADVVAPASTGVAATDTANLQAAFDATPDGGKLKLRSSLYLLNAALTRSTSITIEGPAAVPHFLGHAAGGNAYDPQTPYMAGAVLKQTVAGTDVLQFTGSAISVNLRNFAIVFANGLASTGHGINSTPPAYAGGLDTGLESFRWDNIQVYGHDGNHYAFKLTNPLDGTIVHPRSYGGGGFFLEANSTQDSLGNIVIVHPYVLLNKSGTAGGYVHSSQTSNGIGVGTLNLITYIRPQVNCAGAGQNGTQYTLDDKAGAGQAWNVSLINPDFESGAANGGPNPFRPGASTKAIGNVLIAGYNYSYTALGDKAMPYHATALATAFGGSALAVNTGTRNVGVGGSAGALNTTGTDNTYVGNTAGSKNVTASGLTAIGSQALFNATAANGTALGYNAGYNLTSGPDCTYVGALAGYSNTVNQRCTAVGSQAGYFQTGEKNTAVGAFAHYGASGASGYWNTCVGYGAGYSAAGNTAFALTSGAENTYVGFNSGAPSANQPTASTAVGYQALAGGGNGFTALALGASTSASAHGSVAIGTDNTGTGASAATTNLISIGTALHKVQIKNNTTGAGSAALGANCPATTATAPYTWFAMVSSDGSAVYVPAWK